MKKLLLSAFAFLTIGGLQAQQSPLWIENFDGALTVTNGGANNWFTNSLFRNGTSSSTSAPNCYRDTVPAGPAGTNAYFTTNSFSCAAYGYVAFSFNHICKIPAVQRATIEVSVSGAGGPWIQLTSNEYRANFYHPGTSPLFPNTNYFSSAAYPTTWIPGNDTIAPTASWWKNETFDISGIAAFQPDVRIRFKLTNFDGNGANNGTTKRNFGWLIDDLDLEVAADPPPQVYFIGTNAGSFTLGPFWFMDTIPTTGVSCCNSVYMYYRVNGGPLQSRLMGNPATNIWTDTIPGVNDLDTVCYYFQAINWNNVEGYYPPAFFPYVNLTDPFSIPGATNCFVASSGIHFPYCEDFNSTNGGWTVDSSINQGSYWQWGQPNVGVTSGAYSFPNCWDVDLHAKYVNNTHAYLYSPIFSLTAATSNIKLSFWKNHNVQNGRDGFRLEYDYGNTGSFSTLGYIGDPKATNWYDTTIAGSGSGKPGWSGNTGTWEKCEYFLQQFIGQVGNLQFRFAFDSDNFGNLDGVSIDDFCLVVPPPKDAQMVAILKPGTSSPSGNPDTVRVRIRNVGSTTIRNFTVKYSVNGGPAIAGTVTDSITPASFLDYGFPTLYTIPPGPYCVTAWTDLTGDADRTNDTVTHCSVGIPLVQLPYKDDFDGAVVWYDSSSTTNTHWELGTPNYGVTNAPYSAPNSWDINLSLPYYPSASSVLISPLFNFTGKQDVTMRFWQNRNLNENEDGVRIEYTTTGGGPDGLDWHLLDTSLVDSMYFDQVNWYTHRPITASGRPGWEANSFGWKESKLVLRGLDNAGAAVQFRFIFSSYSVVNAPLDGISIDNFSLKPASNVDAGVVEVLHPTIKGVAGDQDSVRVIIKNYGLGLLTTCQVGYQVNGGAFTSTPQTWTGSLLPYETDTFQIAQKYVVPASYYDLCAYTILATDGDHDNDTACSRPFGIPRKTLTYADNFDALPQNWLGVSVDNVTQWQMGAPNYGVTNTAHSNPTAWDINLNTEYKKNADCELYSPIFNFTNQYNARLSFWHNWSVQNRRDGVRLEYKQHLTDTVWTLLDTLKNLYEENWYNDSSTYNPLKPSIWTGNSATISGASPTGWIQSKMMLRELNNAGPDVQFRFVFRSDNTVNGSGYTMDDFSLAKAPDADAAGVAILNPRKIGISGNSDNLRVIVYNAGNLPLTSMNLVYSINGGAPVSTPWTGNILPGDSAYINVGPMTIPHLAYTLCFWPQVANDGDHSNDTVCVDLFGASKFNISYYDSMNVIPEEFFKIDANNEWEFGTPVSSSVLYACSPPYCWKTKIGGNHSPFRNDYLYSPFFNFSQAYKAEMRLCINYKTEPGNDGGRVDYSLDTGQTWHVLGRSGDGKGVNWYSTNNLSTTGLPAWEDNSNGWINASYRLDTLQYMAPLVQFRFHYSANGSTNYDGLAIDNFEIYNPHRFDIAPIAFDSLPNPYDMSGPQTVKVYVQNRGSIDLARYRITLTSDGTPVVSDQVIVSPPLTYQGITSHTFSVPWNPDLPALGGHDLCAYTELPNDSVDLDQLDDTLCIIAGRFDSVTVNNANPSYCNDFDGNQPKWIPVNSYTETIHGSSWQHGMPAKTLLNSTHSGSTAWVTKLTGDYDPVDSSALYSPVFTVDSAGCYNVSFWHNFQMEDFQDGGAVEYSLDAGASWHFLGYGFDPDWYNSVFITSLSRNPLIPGVAGWTGTSSGTWVYASHNVKFYNPAQAIFRFRFGSDASLEMEGWAIDNFCLQKIGPCTIGVSDLDGTQFALGQNIPNPASRTTSISYVLPAHGHARMVITDLLGREIQTVFDEDQMAGQYMRELNVSGYSNGIYFYTLEFEGKRLIGKMVIAE